MNDTEFENALKNVVRVCYGDDSDLIRRGDALKAIRQRCISEHLPFKSNTPVGARVLDALAAVYQVKPYKDVCGKWISVKDRLPEVRLIVLAYAAPTNGIHFAFRERGSENFVDCDSGYYLNTVTHWMPLPKPPEVTP